MKKYKIIIILSVAIMMLFAITFLPNVLFHIYDQQILGKVKTESIPEAVPIDISTMNVTSRIALISRYSREGKDIVRVDQDQYSEGTALVDDAVKNSLKEVRKLQELGMFPEMDLSNGANFHNLQIQTYIDMGAPSNSVKICRTLFSLGEYNFSVFLDTEKNLIYQYMVWSDTLNLKLNYDVIPSVFAKYLDFQWNNEVIYNEDGSKRYTEANGQFAYKFEFSEDGKSLIVQLIKGEN